MEILILAGVVAPHHCGSVRTEHNGEDVRAQNNLGDVCWTIENVRTVEHPQRLMACHGHRQIVACEHLSGLAPRSLVPARLLLKATPGECAPVAEGRSAIVPLHALMEMAPPAFGWDPRSRHAADATSFILALCRTPIASRASRRARFFW